MTKTFRLDDFNFSATVGKFAQQADGSVWFQQGGTVILATVVSAPSKEFPGFLPLTIDYREQFSAAGKIPGGYFKREGRATDREILIGRLIDRSVRPLFPERFFDQVQILVTVYSVDKEHAPHTLALIATSLALSISNVPFLGPVAALEAGLVDGKWVMNPSYPQSRTSTARLVIAGTDEGVCMVEGSANELNEKEFVDTMFNAHSELKKIIAWQEQIQKEIGKTKKAVDNGSYDWNAWEQKIDSYLTDDRVKKVFVADKVTRNENLDVLRETFMEEQKAYIEESQTPSSFVDYIFNAILQKKITDLIFTLGKRVDDRSFDQIRKIAVEVGLLPCTHGSALFTRGRTQALVSLTLGGGQDEQRTETIMDAEDNTRDGAFMLHYNFPPFSVGEVRPQRGPGRREIGHGHLARSGLLPILPDKESFPYTIRIVADMLESDGSTSMATVCGSTMALMQGGVPITQMVGGVAMGLLKSSKGQFQVLSDISGFEDAFGLMDFKVVGTDKGITAIQLDIKYKSGFPKEVFQRALEQARNGRLHILGEMRKVMDKPNPTLSDLVPKVTVFKVDNDKIGAIIGSGGKTIREIIDVTKTSIDIEPDGTVKIFGGPEADINRAIRWVKVLAGQIEPQQIFDGFIRRIAEFGLFVELVPGVQGLLHVSNLPKDKQRSFQKDYKPNDPCTVEVIDYDDSNGRISLKFKGN